MSDIIITIDLEQDISKYLKNSYIGITDGIPKILDEFDLFGVKADFFTTADICLKFPDTLNQIIASGHSIGCHSFDHSISYFGRENFEKQLNDISRATDVLKKTLGKPPTSFRAPNFSINGDTIKALERLGYMIDSSILPGRKIKKLKVFTILDYTNSPTKIYTPSYTDASVYGKSKILEVPLTENPLSKGSPLGLGFLNSYGLEKTIEAVNKVYSNYITFLIHPWEAVDLGKYHPNMRSWLHKACSGDMTLFHKFLENVNKSHKFSQICEVVDEYRTNYA